MSITVSDCLKLPALRDAQVVAGRGGLNKIVTSVSVLEYAEHSLLADDLFVGNELIITAFTSVKDDVEGQCLALRRLWETGEVGLVLYYLGIFISRLDERVLALADELDFPLICMPADRFDFRYSEVLSEVYEAIFQKRSQESYYVRGILDIIAQMTERQRTINAVLRLLSDRLHCTFLLTDRSFTPRGFAAWPMAAQWDVAEILEQYRLCPAIPTAEHPATVRLESGDICMSHILVELEQRLDMHLLALNPESLPGASLLLQAAEVIQLYVNIWKCDFGSEGPDALVRAILNDDPINMRRIAEALHIDVASIHTMWVLRSGKDSQSAAEQRTASARHAIVAKLFLQEHRKLALVDTFENSVVAFMDDSPYPELDSGLAERFIATLCEKGEEPTLVVCGSLSTTKDVRQAYMLIDDALACAKKIFSARNMLTLYELQFARDAKNLLAQGETAVEEALSPLSPLRQQEDAEELVQTLSTFLLDAQSSMQETSEKLFLHKNTVKYRINKIKQRLGYDVTKMPEAYSLYRAAALLRLLG